MDNARISPDGHAVAFVSPVAGTAQVFLMLTSGGDPLQLTNDEGDKFVTAFSPDGKEIYYERTLGSDEVWAVPALGGAPHHVVFGGFATPSEKGDSIFYTDSEHYGIFRVAKSGLNQELVYEPKNKDRYVAPVLLFPGGHDLLAAGIRDPLDWSDFRLYRINLTSHEAVDLGEVSGSLEDNPNVVWADPGKTVLFSRTINRLTNIWKYSLNDRSLTQITFGTGPDFSPMPDPGGKGIYYVNGKSSGLLTTYHVHSKVFADIASDDASQPAISPDGKRVMYVTLPAPQKSELWVSDINGGNKIKIAAGEVLGTGLWAPDSSHVLYFDYARGHATGYVVGSDGNGLRQIPLAAKDIWALAWSPDQKTVYVTGITDAAPIASLWRWSVGALNSEKLLDNCGGGIATDADRSGRYLLWVVLLGKKPGIYEIPISHPQCISLIPGVATYGAGFARDGKSFLYAAASRGKVTIYRQSWSDGKLTGALRSL